MSLQAHSRARRAIRTITRVAAALAVCALAFRSGLPLTPGHAEQARHAVTLQDSRVYELGELMRVMRQQSGLNVHADSRQHSRRLFVSRGTYELSELLTAIRVATGMSLRQVGQTRFLALPDPTLGGRLLFPLLPEKTVHRLGKVLRPLAERADLPKEGIPFASRQFLAREIVPFGQMTPEQQDFVVEEYSYHMAKRSMDSHEVLAHKARQNLANSNVRLGTSYLMAFVAYQPAASPTEADARSFLRVSQVYYDYRDRFGVTLPEE